LSFAHKGDIPGDVFHSVAVPDADFEKRTVDIIFHHHAPIRGLLRRCTQVDAVAPGFLNPQLLHPHVLASQKCQAMPPLRFLISGGRIVLFVHPDAGQLAAILLSATDNHLFAFLERQPIVPLRLVSAL